MDNERTILAPLDGSIIAEGVLPHAEAIANALNATIRIMLVLPAGSNAVAATAQFGSQPAPHEAELTIAATAQELRRHGVEVTTMVERGDPAEQILAAAEHRDVQLVVMATHGRGGLERLLIGSVADEVMRRCVRATLLVKPANSASPGARVALRRLMVPLDGSDLAEQALPMAVRLAEASGAHLVLVQALTPVAESLAPGTYIPDLGKWQTEAEAAAQSYLQQVASRLPARVETETVVLQGISPATILVELARSKKVDLVVMSTHGYGGLHRLAIGSKADLMVRSGLPALLVRPAEIEQSRKRAAVLLSAGR